MCEAEGHAGDCKSISDIFLFFFQMWCNTQSRMSPAGMIAQSAKMNSLTEPSLFHVLTLKVQGRCHSSLLGFDVKKILRILLDVSSESQAITRGWRGKLLSSHALNISSFAMRGALTDLVDGSSSPIPFHLKTRGFHVCALPSIVSCTCAQLITGN